MGYKEIEDIKLLIISWCSVLKYFRLFCFAVYAVLAIELKTQV
jgi:hypothetical protein